ncbi:UbiA family prenyltransferase [Paradesertivirga mongoliensis]|uniref:UbiA family prenyltransferase n=1 Tax=Paradesertivirga mongoliensis TaxID=2100740 RepID=A0ABW4ZGP2_9SPHI|nr:UbiA family prenyltransferase [Pedobacter mongoliensis]
MSEPGPSSIYKLFYKALDFLLFSNLFIALCAVAQAQVTYHLLGIPCDKQVLGILFFATLALYNFSTFMAKPAEPRKSPFRRVRWTHRNYRLMITLTLIAVLSLMVITLFLAPASQVLLLFLGVIAVSYNLPLFTVGEKRFGLRNVPGLKLFLIALIWSLSCVLLPIVELGNSQSFFVSPSDTILLVAKRFLFIAAITVPFDIRDLFQDKSYDLKTIPVILGERKSYLVCQLLLFAYICLLFLFTRNINSDFFALVFTILITGWLIFKSEWKKNEYYYFLYLDGTMILQFVFLVAFSVAFS